MHTKLVKLIEKVTNVPNKTLSMCSTWNKKSTSQAIVRTSVKSNSTALDCETLLKCRLEITA